MFINLFFHSLFPFSIITLVMHGNYLMEIGFHAGNAMIKISLYLSLHYFKFMRWTKLKRYTLRCPYSVCIRWFIGKEQNEAANSTHSRSITIERFSGKTKRCGGESARSTPRWEANLLAQYQLSEMKHSAVAALMQIPLLRCVAACTSL